MRVKILGKFWSIIFAPNLKEKGYCDPPTAKNKKIWIWKGLKDEEELEIILHEMLHAAFWKVDEEFITDAAKDIARALWKLNYRKKE